MSEDYRAMTRDEGKKRFSRDELSRAYISKRLLYVPDPKDISARQSLMKEIGFVCLCEAYDYGLKPVYCFRRQLTDEETEVLELQPWVDC